MNGNENSDLRFNSIHGRTRRHVGTEVEAESYEGLRCGSLIALTLLLHGTLAHAFQDPAEKQLPAAAEPAMEKFDLEKQQEETFEQADKALKTATEDVKRERESLLARTRSLITGVEKTELFQRMSRTSRVDQDFTTARDAALEIDETALRERVRSLILLAEAEAASGDATTARLTLQEAQEHALQIRQPETLIGVLREISKADRDMFSRWGATQKTDRQPLKAEQLATQVMNYGLPPEGYREIEILREGGGPEREPMLISHTYFYNGDRWYQGPFLKGGPTIVCVTHPKTGCSTATAINMPRGAPIIEYSERKIEYYFPDVMVELEFELDGDTEVDYRTLGNRYQSLRRKIEKRAVADRHALESGDGTSDIAGGLLGIGLGAPLNVGTRLPVLSDLLKRSGTRTPATLTNPRTIND